ncbi:MULTISPECIES: PrsW family intramembrane metalloprotease [unclassified Tessaracoccus]|uniref:PrsW family intramembrane metalloprotease n=1 Tax=unclassified Tessaracoccus TaxID=2635419 RepID=UPI00096FF695|nr:MULTISPECIES: PrsW family intramembrane metalloprotease [unclassified Tessaracoccus]MBB1509301.1 PrsW family intramembrane metalloprotease [Tessaracoccus sp. MC1756]MCG6567128.1 protease PrsW [Tessaracoccus sp. ZS01]OMG57531.1 hypothetical protein BJN44_05750 [Tessaracoccus sp. ZS01]
MSTAQISQPTTRGRWLNGLPQDGPRRPWYLRLLRSPLFWLALILFPLYFWALYDQYWMLHPEQTFEDGTRSLGISNEALKLGAYWAMWTGLAYTTLFILLDRFRASSPVVWLLALGWGACASTWFSIHVNTWMGQAMATTQANSDAGSRAAIFSAPFVEEFAKATILVLLVILWRNKIVSRLSIITLAGLSAVGFAFTENIIYYGRVWMQATHDITIAEPAESFMELVMLRGVYTSFGHPLFTMMTAAGLAVGLGARSKWVRVMAPVGGYLLACAGHMLFNGLSSTNSIDNLMIQWYMALGLVAVIVISLIVSIVGNAQIIRARLGDYQHAGWLTERDVELYGRPLRRAKLLLYALFRGPRIWWRTSKLVRRVTELAYLRNAMTRGLVSEAGDDRAHQLITEIHSLQQITFSDYAGQPMIPPRKKKASELPPPPEEGPGGPLTSNYAQPVAPGPAGVGGNYPVRS